MQPTEGPYRLDEDGLFIWADSPDKRLADICVAEVRGAGWMRYRPAGEQEQQANAQLLAASWTMRRALVRTHRALTKAFERGEADAELMSVLREVDQALVCSGGDW